MKDSHKYSCGFFYVKYKNFKEEEKRNVPGFSFITSKKEFKKAVDRNHARRVLRECVDAYITKFPVKAYLFFIQKSIEDADFIDLKKEVEKFVSTL